MTLQGRIYTISKQGQELDANAKFLSMIQESVDNDVVVIDGRNIAAGTIYANQIHADAITADHIRADSITSDHLDVGRIDVAELWGENLILPGRDYGGVTINNEGMSMKSSGLDVTLSSSSGFNITDKTGNQLIDIDPLTGNMKLEVSQLVIGGYKAATENKLEERINDIELTPGPAGPEGKGVSTVVREFQNSSSGTTIPTGNWSETPNPVKGQYMWERVTTNYTKGTPDVSHSVTYSAKDGTPGSPGAPGTPGAPGEAGVGVSGDKIEYASSTSGTTIPENGWDSSIPSVPEGQFLWTRTTITYTNDEKTETYTSAKQGEKGEPGADAISGVLTNESITFAADSSGTIAAQNYVGNTGNFLLMEGAINRSSSTSTTYSKVSETNVKVTISSNGAYTISSMTDGTSVTTGQVTFRATYKNTTIDKTISISKSIAGQAGSPGAKGDPGAPGSTGAPGAAGSHATSYWTTSSVDTITMKYDGDYDPKVITFYGHSKTGTSNATTYAGRFIIQTSTNGTSYTQAYVSSSNQSSYAFTIPSNVSFVKAKFYQAGGTTYLLDEQTVPVLQSAENLEVGGRNLIIRNTETPDGWISGTGAVVPTPNHDTSDYINVEPNTEYMLTKSNSELATDAGFFRWAWYDVDMVYIARRADSNNEILWKTPNNVHYVRVSYPTDSTPKLEKGNTATDWTEAPEDTHAKINERPTFDDFVKTDKVTIDGGNITAGQISSKNNYSRINLDDGTFSFGNGRLVWNGSGMTVNGTIEVKNIVGEIGKDKLDTSVKGDLAAGAEANTTVSANKTKWNSAEENAKNYADGAIGNIEVGGRNLLLNTKGITMNGSDSGNNNLSVVGSDGMVTITPKK